MVWYVAIKHGAMAKAVRRVVCRLAPAAALHQFINARIGAFQGGVARRAAAHAADSRCAPVPQKCCKRASLGCCRPHVVGGRPPVTAACVRAR